METRYYVGIIAGAGVVVGTLLLQHLERRARRSSLRSRRCLGDHELRGLFESNGITSEAVFRSLSLIADALRVEKGRLRPDDTIAQFRPKVMFLFSDLDDLEASVRESVNIPAKKIPWNKLQTFGELVSFVALHERCIEKIGRKRDIENE